MYLVIKIAYFVSRKYSNYNTNKGCIVLNKKWHITIYKNSRNFDKTTTKYLFCSCNIATSIGHVSLYKQCSVSLQPLMTSGAFFNDTFLRMADWWFFVCPFHFSSHLKNPCVSENPYMGVHDVLSDGLLCGIVM